MQTGIFLLLSAAWFLFLFSSGKIQSYDWYPYLIASRAALCLLAIGFAYYFYQSPSWLAITKYLLLCLLVQSIFGALEPANSLEFYQYCAYFLFLAGWSFSGTFKEWITKYFPVASIGLVTPLFFKQAHYFESLGTFIYEFTTTVVMVFLSFATVLSSSKRYKMLLQNLDLRERLLSVEKSKKAEIEKEVRRLRSQIEADSRSHAYLQVTEHVFHDLQAPLAVVKTALKLADPEISEDYSSLIHSGINRIEAIICDLASRGKIEVKNPPKETSLENSPVADLIQSVIEEQKILNSSRSGLEIDFRFPDFPTTAECRVVNSEFKRALSNLLNNSIEAITESGKVLGPKFLEIRLIARKKQSTGT